MHKSVILDLLHSLYWSVNCEGVFNLRLGGVEHQVANIEDLDLHEGESGGDRRRREEKGERWLSF